MGPSSGTAGLPPRRSFACSTGSPGSTRMSPRASTRILAMAALSLQASPSGSRTAPSCVYSSASASRSQLASLSPWLALLVVASPPCFTCCCTSTIHRAGLSRWGGMDLRCFDVAWWRRQLGVVGQEPVLFDASLEENVRYGCPGATRAQVEDAALEANMDYAFTGSVGWEDRLGIRGERLSGGQKQRCAIARAIIRQPQVLLLDEATSPLDSASEYIVQQALDRARLGRTTFTIAHRLSTIEDSDLILVLVAGTLAETGTHVELLAAQGVYASLTRRAK
mmetsp:Transcript_30347/g.87102  ORF Transcript_30347/g.87102 Transcript_30347/m.87102 type:complete len:280 (-) Transcript_30347:391-1230(-)